MSAKLGIIAGRGDLPMDIAMHAKSESREVFIVGIKGFVEERLLSSFPSAIISIGEVGKQLSTLKKNGVEEVCFAGIVSRPDFQNLKLDAKGLLLLPKVLKAASQGDDALLRVLVEIIEKEGFRVVGADDVYSRLLAQHGALGKVKPSEQDMVDIRKGANVASELGRLDIGQGAVVCSGLVLAVEAQEGTDMMLLRCASLPEDIRGTAFSRRGVLVKRPKPVQERRIDLPTIGLNTLKNAYDAGLAGIAIEAGGALILNRTEVIKEADKLGLWIYSFNPAEC